MQVFTSFVQGIDTKKLPGNFFERRKEQEWNNFYFLHPAKNGEPTINIYNSSANKCRCITQQPY